MSRERPIDYKDVSRISCRVARDNGLSYHDDGLLITMWNPVKSEAGNGGTIRVLKSSSSVLVERESGSEEYHERFGTAEEAGRAIEEEAVHLVVGRMPISDSALREVCTEAAIDAGFEYRDDGSLITMWRRMAAGPDTQSGDRLLVLYGGGNVLVEGVHRSKSFYKETDFKTPGEVGKAIREQASYVR